jgi:coenzyme F420-0:L-glutamate ligase/coenzyme F420-1:gamma-L-glutamate ligase
VTVEVIPVRGLPEVRPGDDLVSLIWAALSRGGPALVRGGPALAPGDVVVVTQKVVSKAEGRVVPEGPGGKAEWVERETRRILARRGDLVIAETRHGFVCAHAGVDASNIAEGFLSLLPEDPDGSAERIRAALGDASGVSIGVVVTDTFGRPWRTGLVNVAIGCAGLPSLVDLRGTKDALGRELEATVVALADEIAASSGLVMGKSDGVPVAIVRGVRMEDQPQPAAALVRPAEEDLFRLSPLEALQSAQDTRRFGPGAVPREALHEALRVASARRHSEGPPDWLFVSIDSATARRQLVSALHGDSREILAIAPAILVPCARLGGSAGDRPDRDALLLSSGRLVERLVLALQAVALASCWVPGIAFWAEGSHQLGLEEGWSPLGAVAIGRPVDEKPAWPEPLGAEGFVVETR